METLTRIVHHPNGRPYCITECHTAEGWLQTTWLGFVSQADAEQGALAALEPLCQGPVAGLLNDNSEIKGPWFDSIAWLRRVWAPQAAQLGLRYIAHVAQPHTEADLGILFSRNPFGNYVDLQVFTTIEDASDWLRTCLLYPHHT
ncbi:hypothetical protein QMK33_08935 [Hymenobacter sp. H14-R3]|uniref:hypothetical protein n=1 Tax=Hymenobacter sp. H14-R3 TaxID=3046308 RepID=UPI0024BB68C0|nr:hypothetical protein [Hymenobacter sp. H14-R3]MDJ0365277.1 hypothetical protein [Hymenobacter sp. H14-R3]